MRKLYPQKNFARNNNCSICGTHIPKRFRLADSKTRVRCYCSKDCYFVSKRMSAHGVEAIHGFDTVSKIIAMSLMGLSGLCILLLYFMFA